MRYKLRPGITLTHICGEAILVAAYEARQHCPYTTVLNETGEVIFNALKVGRSVKEIAAELNETFDIPEGTDVEGLCIEYIKQLHDNGYVLYEED